MEWYLKVLKQYADFNGRARRTEYWMFILFNIIMSVVLMVLDYAMGTLYFLGGSGLLGTLYSLFVLIPSLAVLIRRLHDLDKSGWMILIIFIPIIGAIWLLVLCATEGTIGPNKYGPDPKDLNASPFPEDGILDA